MQHIKRNLVYGFAVFSMFFGSGNLVFPLQIGRFAGEHWLLGFFGLFLTGVLLPFLGLFVIKLYRGNYNVFFEEAGRLAKVFLPPVCLALMGSFGIVPRCIAVAHGGVHIVAPNIALWPFSLLFCAAMFLVSLREDLIFKILGRWLSPTLAVTIFICMLVAIIHAPASHTTAKALTSFDYGFINGYQTMDMLGAYFFSALVFAQLRQSMPCDLSPMAAVRYALPVSLIGAGLLGLVYVGFVYLGAHYSANLSAVPPEEILPSIVKSSMGGFATVMISLLVVLSCFTTAVALNNLFARYIFETLRLSDKHFVWVALSTTVIAFLVSLFDFKGIAVFLAPILQATYPGLIALTLLSIFSKKLRLLKVGLFYGLTIAMILYLVAS